MDYIIDGFGIPVMYDLSIEGALLYIPDNLPKSTRQELERKLHGEHDVVSIREVPQLVAIYHGVKFQKAHDELVELYKNARLKFSINSERADI